jgi:serine protease DegQ
MKWLPLNSTLLSGLCLLAIQMLSASNVFAALPNQMNEQPFPSLAPILKKATPAVVSLQILGRAKTEVPDMHKYLFGSEHQAVQEQPFQGIGSGVIIDAKNGYIITNHHVIQQSYKIIVGLHDGRKVEAKLIGSDELADLALLQIKTDNLTEIKKADSNNIEVGDFVVAIGNPFNLGQTVTSGIVSALGRSDLGIKHLENFIQTDAAINRGNSGGALINMRGELIGINTAIVNQGGGNVGIGFAIPINMANNLIPQIIKYGQARRGLLGIKGRNLTIKLAEAFGLKNKDGVFIEKVIENSAAQAAGIEVGDIIVQLDSHPVKSYGNLRATISTLGAGKEVSLDIIRDGQRKKFSVKLMNVSTKLNYQSSIHPGLTGATFKNHQNGIMVVKISPKSPASMNGLKSGDIIIGVNRHLTNNIKTLNEILQENQTAFALKVERNHQPFYLVLR